MSQLGPGIPPFDYGFTLPPQTLISGNISAAAKALDAVRQELLIQIQTCKNNSSATATEIANCIHATIAQVVCNHRELLTSLRDCMAAGVQNALSAVYEITGQYGIVKSAIYALEDHGCAESTLPYSGEPGLPTCQAGQTGSTISASNQLQPNTGPQSGIVPVSASAASLSSAQRGIASTISPSVSGSAPTGLPGIGAVTAPPSDGSFVPTAQSCQPVANIIYGTTTGSGLDATIASAVVYPGSQCPLTHSWYWCEKFKQPPMGVNFVSHGYCCLCLPNPLPAQRWYDMTIGAYWDVNAGPFSDPSKCSVGPGAGGVPGATGGQPSPQPTPTPSTCCLSDAGLMAAVKYLCDCLKGISQSQTTSKTVVDPYVDIIRGEIPEESKPLEAWGGSGLTAMYQSADETDFFSAMDKIDDWS